VLWIIIAVLTFFLSYSLYKNYKFGMTILRMEDAIEDALDVINSKYERMSEILRRPLFFDSSEVRQVIIDIKAVRNSLHEVALSLTENIEEDKDSE